MSDLEGCSCHNGAGEDKEQAQVVWDFSWEMLLYTAVDTSSGQSIVAMSLGFWAVAWSGPWLQL